MKARDTLLGGPAGPFPATVWTDIVHAANPMTPEGCRALEGILRRYWKPIYAYIRTGWHKSVEDSKDLTQAFLCRFLEGNYFRRIRRELGNFRSYLKKALRNFLLKQKRSDRVRRPSGRRLDLDSAPDDVTGETPDQAFEREWSRALSNQAIERLREILRQDGKQVYFDLFQSYCLKDDGAALTYGDLAARHRISETDVGNYLTFCRRALRQIVRGLVLEYVDSEGEVEDEIRRFVP